MFEVERPSEEIYDVMTSIHHTITIILKKGYYVSKQSSFTAHWDHF